MLKLHQNHVRNMLLCVLSKLCTYYFVRIDFLSRRLWPRINMIPANGFDQTIDHTRQRLRHFAVTTQRGRLCLLRLTYYHVPDFSSIICRSVELPCLSWGRSTGSAYSQNFSRRFFETLFWKLRSFPFPTSVDADKCKANQVDCDMLVNPVCLSKSQDALSSKIGSCHRKILKSTGHLVIPDFSRP